MHRNVVDAHAHLLPPRLQAAIRGFFDRYGIESGRFAYPADPGDVCDRLAAEGVSEVWSLPYARRPGSAADRNKSMAGLVAARRGGPVRVTGGCTVHPGDDQPLTIVRSAVEDMGLRVLKLHCSVGTSPPTTRAWTRSGSTRRRWPCRSCCTPATRPTATRRPPGRR